MEILVRPPKSLDDETKRLLETYGSKSVVDAVRAPSHLWSNYSLVIDGNGRQKSFRSSDVLPGAPGTARGESS